MKYRRATPATFSHFFEKAFVRRMNRRIDIRIVRCWRSTSLVEPCSGSGLPVTSCRNGTQGFRGAIPLLRSGRTVDVYEHRVIDVLAERSFHGLSRQTLWPSV